MILAPHVQARLRRRFAQSLPATLEGMRRLEARLAAGARDAGVQARMAGHKLAGTGRSFGMPRLSVLGRQLEHATEEELDLALARLIDAIAHAIGHAGTPDDVGSEAFVAAD